ncbi:MAG: tRNA uridine-5-carboxymethylaminomethyl(34) synthesis GTPase MnmE [Gammaproteobacteria bacterium]|nr:tRNA uridine-5-carboxymethylaminomethyl(34) synthesis GTPase MnmE [Gammaproteobacteria bacterium]MDG2339002.1 tRNA uridine-5-carboxymethylaminomethyl(34) synthesis GTPase MnmE [Gammaproteobacteria bacterium]
MSQFETDTICAIATAPGRSGVGIIRVSGPRVLSIAETVLGFNPTARKAHFCNFLDADSQTIDQGIALYFSGPNSFTGEDVLELQGHGGMYVLKDLLDRVASIGARLANPGEFSERAFLNNKIDLLQAEAIADLIESNSTQAAKSAMRTLKGEFSRKIHTLLEQLIEARVHIEATIDFSDEDIDFVSDNKVGETLHIIHASIQQTLVQAKQGALLKEGLNVVIAGKPNAGKSSLLNALSGSETAIVTDIPGTTRDLLTEEINIDGLPVHIIDTAGIRVSEDLVEQEGLRRAQLAIEQADRILLIVDRSVSVEGVEEHLEKLLAPLVLLADKSIKDLNYLKNTTIVYNKIDLVNNIDQGISSIDYLDYSLPVISLSAKENIGIDSLRNYLKEIVGYNATEEGAFIARERHLTALSNANKLIESALEQLNSQSSLELIAEDLRISQSQLGTITGEFTSDDLLGEIFSNFCVGK